jgi:hypothetical protein
MSSGEEQVFSEITCNVIMKQQILARIIRPIEMKQKVLAKIAYLVD